MTQPSIPKGTRDFGPEIMLKREYIIETIKKVFKKYAFAPLETPSMEQLNVLTGKYGEEGDQLIFKILNSGDFLKDLKEKNIPIANTTAKEILPYISEKALRYDLTVPFARYVTMNRNDITFPFRRYQIQPVWRADRPQKGRYREFYQCDADIIGSDSLICEAELILIIQEVLTNLKIKEFTIKMNNRKILTGIAEKSGAVGRETDICVAIDKLDKIGDEGVKKELSERGISNESIEILMPVIQFQGNTTEKISYLKTFLQGNEIGISGIDEIEKTISTVSILGQVPQLELDISLARGLSYYTGAIFEVKANGVQIGSISGGGRYDNLTGLFGLNGISGVGISFGLDRIYDVMQELNVFEHISQVQTKVLITIFDEKSEGYSIELLSKLRTIGIRTEIYPQADKLKKQFAYADAKKIPYVVIIGENEIKNKLYSLKKMETGEQKELKIEELLTLLSE
ncbi:MAG: histidine--tRNA ligase [Bacteroidota bacterium]|nr:histidine--tRNA ligase [Bacteroidota bacterium]